MERAREAALFFEHHLRHYLRHTAAIARRFEALGPSGSAFVHQPCGYAEVRQPDAASVRRASPWPIPERALPA